jgi:hypothetical protein
MPTLPSEVRVCTPTAESIRSGIGASTVRTQHSSHKTLMMEAGKVSEMLHINLIFILSRVGAVRDLKERFWIG